MNTILLANPLAQYQSMESEINQAIQTVLNSGNFILGQNVKCFEQAFANFIGVSHGIGVASGTNALFLALKALDVDRNDEVITVSHTAVATVAAICQSGATPVFVDIDAEFYTMDPSKLEHAITPQTKAIIVVHLYGQPADMDAIAKIAKKHQIPIIEDCAQSAGAQFKGKCVGSIGDIGCFSFYPTKNLGAIGDGGMVVTDQSAIAEKICHLRQYGWEKRYISETQGYNSRLDEIQAAILNVKLPHLVAANQCRRDIASKYSKKLQSLNLVLPKERLNTEHVFHLYVCRTPNRNELIKYLAQNGVQAGIHYPKAVHQQPAYSMYAREELLNTDKISSEIISLPMYPELNEAEIEIIILAIKNFYQEHKILDT